MQKFLLLFIFGLSAIVSLHAQAYEISFAPFEHSTGSQYPLQQTSPLKKEVVFLNNQLGSKSSLGPTINLNGNVVVIDYIERIQDGNTLVIIRREDGKKFFGHLATLKAILKPIGNADSNSDIVSN